MRPPNPDDQEILEGPTSVDGITNEDSNIQAAPGTTLPILGLTADQRKEFNSHKQFLTGFAIKKGSAGQKAHDEEVATTPLFAGNVLVGLGDQKFNQYGLLAEMDTGVQSDGDDVAETSKKYQQGFESANGDGRVLVNVGPPWSAFICGSQGSGKSHTLSCILENCLVKSSLGKLNHPLAGMVFHWDRFTAYGSSQVCEAAFLCSSGIPVRVLVSRTNFWKMKETYENLPLPKGSRKPEVVPLLFKDDHLDIKKMMSMMAVTDKEGPMPLYIEVILTFPRPRRRVFRLGKNLLTDSRRSFIVSSAKWPSKVAAKEASITVPSDSVSIKRPSLGSNPAHSDYAWTSWRASWKTRLKRACRASSKRASTARA